MAAARLRTIFTRFSRPATTLAGMKLLRSILVAVDGSHPSDAAIAAACVLARDFGAKISGCHVLETHPYLQGRHVEWLPEVEAEKRREAMEIAREAETIAHDSGVRMHVALVDGDPINEVLRSAAQVGADSIIVGNRGQNALSTLLVGSVAQGIVERGSLPVMVVRATPLEK
jgi:nucleotide-binding universal stress UspA family protein